MKTWAKVLIGIAIALVVLLVVAYFGMGYVIYASSGTSKARATSTGQPPRQLRACTVARRFDLTPYFMSALRDGAGSPAARPGSRSPAGGSSGDPEAPAVHHGARARRLQERHRYARAGRDAVAQRLQRAADRSARHRRVGPEDVPLVHRQRRVPGRAGRLGLAGQGEGLRSGAASGSSRTPWAAPPPSMPSPRSRASRPCSCNRPSAICGRSSRPS